MNENLVFGIHSVISLLQSSVRKILKIKISDQPNQRLELIINQAESKNIHLEYLKQEQWKEYSNFSHQGVIAFATPINYLTEKDVIDLLKTTTKAFILILDGITDPHNLGACLRTADAVGVDLVILPKDKNASVTPIVSKVAAGAVDKIPLAKVTNLARIIDQLKQNSVWVFGADGKAKKTLYDFDLNLSLAIVLGAEDKGLRRLTKDKCDELFSIPMFGYVESLNVSVATAISLYECKRQRLNI